MDASVATEYRVTKPKAGRKLLTDPAKLKRNEQVRNAQRKYRAKNKKKMEDLEEEVRMLRKEVEQLRTEKILLEQQITTPSSLLDQQMQVDLQQIDLGLLDALSMPEMPTKTQTQENKFVHYSLTREESQSVDESLSKTNTPGQEHVFTPPNCRPVVINNSNAIIQDLDEALLRAIMDDAMSVKEIFGQQKEDEDVKKESFDDVFENIFDSYEVPQMKHDKNFDGNFNGNNDNNEGDAFENDIIFDGLNGLINLDGINDTTDGMDAACDASEKFAVESSSFVIRKKSNLIKIEENGKYIVLLKKSDIGGVSLLLGENEKKSCPSLFPKSEETCPSLFPKPAL